MQLSYCLRAALTHCMKVIYVTFYVTHLTYSLSQKIHRWILLSSMAAYSRYVSISGIWLSLFCAMTLLKGLLNSTSLTRSKKLAPKSCSASAGVLSKKLGIDYFFFLYDFFNKYNGCQPTTPKDHRELFWPHSSLGSVTPRKGCSANKPAKLHTALIVATSWRYHNRCGDFSSLLQGFA